MTRSPEFVRLCKLNALNLSAVQLERLECYVNHLLSWNQRVNLISRKDESNVWVSHILHSLCLLQRVELPAGSRVLDLGSGGGLPGVPIAILRPDLQITLLDSVRKKTEAVRDIVSGLSMSNLTVTWGRAGEIRLKVASSDGFDVVIARAVAPLKDLIRWSLTLVRRSDPTTRGKEAKTPPASFSIPVLIAMKGGSLEQELRSAQVRYGNKRISTLDLVVKGVSDIELVEKKLVAVEL
jgi:16S rRNA (guanine527-N7)-methyltransferase